MTYQVLARKWRPKDFASLVGQEHVVRALTHALDGGRLHHAYLFTGTRGVGKTTLSRIFAKALNCETGVTSTPCGVCRACREIDEGRFVDYVEMDAASNRGVDEMAALLERAVYAPVDARFKVYMIDEVHMLTNHAFNAMLKTLEEPPSHVKFILATTDPQKIPVTVLSRCLQFNLKQMPAGHIVSHLERILGEEHVPFEVQALRLLARSADGSMRDALSLTDQAIAYSANQVTEEAVRGMLGALDQSYLIRLLDALADGDGAAVLSVADEMSLRSLSFSTALQDLASLLHRIAWAQFHPSSVLDEWPEAVDLRRFAEALSAEQVQLFYQIATIGRSELGLAPDEYAGFTMTLLRMLAFEPAPTGGGGAASSARGAGAAGPNGAGKRSGTPAMAAPQAAVPTRAAGQAAPVAAPQVAPVVMSRMGAGALDAAPGQPVAATQEIIATQDASVSAQDEAAQNTVATPAVLDQDVAASAEERGVAEGGVSADRGVVASQVEAAANATHDAVEPLTSDAPVPSSSTAPVAGELEDSAASSASLSASAFESAPTSPDESAPESPAVSVPASASEFVSKPAAVTASAAAASAAATPAGAAREEAPAVDLAPRRASGASAALDVLRSAGLKVSSDRGRASAVAAAAKPVPAMPPKAAAPRVNVPVPTPGTPRRTPETPDTTGAMAAPGASGARAPARPSMQRGAEQGASAVPPWDDMPPDDFVPLSAEDDYFGPPDDGYMPVFDSGPDDVRVSNAAPAPAPVDTRPLPPAIALDAIGFNGDWPALAVGLSLKGISYQLAFNSELMALEGTLLKLSVPVPQYAETSQVAKLKAALAERLGKEVEVQVVVGPARRTAAAFDAAARAQRQKEAEREIGTDPFVQSLIREFGASIVPGSIRPIAQDAQGNQPSTH